MSVPNPLLSASASPSSSSAQATAAAAAGAAAEANPTTKINRLIAEKVRATEVTNAAAAAAAASLQQRPSHHVYHRQHPHHKQQHHPHHPPPAAAAAAVPGMFNFNHPMMGGFPYPATTTTQAAAAAGMNYFHPGSFVLPPPTVAAHSAASAPPLAATATTAAATTVSGDKRKTTTSNKYTAAMQRFAKKQRPSSSPDAMIDLTTQDPQHKSTNTPETTPRDPPGFEAFQRDPSFITAIMASRMKENGNTDRLLGPLARGIINMTDEEIFKLSNDENDSTMRVFITDVIMPLLGIDDHIAQSNYAIWQGYAHISSENLQSLAKNFFYVRRSSMKAAVQVAFFEMRKNHQKLLQGTSLSSSSGGQSGGSSRISSSNSTAVSSSDATAAAAAATRKIEQLTLALQKQKEENAKMIQQIEEIYESDIADMRNDHKMHVEELKEAHRKEVEELRVEMEDMKCSHREFLGHYVEAAAEAVRLAQKQGKSSSLGRSVSDL